MILGFLEIIVSSRLDEALSKAAAGTPIIVRARRAATKKWLIDRAVHGFGGFETLEVDPRSGPAQQVLLEAAASLAPGLANLADLAMAQELEFKLFVVDVREVDAGPWLTLAGAFATLRSAAVDGPALALITGAVAIPAGCELIDDGALIGPPEAAVYVRERRGVAGLLADCGDAAAIEVSRGDLHQLNEMLSLPDRERFDPTLWIGKQPFSDEKLIWRGAEEVCATWLAINSQTRLRHRIWRGHVSVMFPWLAEALGEFVAAQGRRLPSSIPDKFSGEAISRDDFEWGDIVFALRSSPPALVECAHRLRVLRNALAHQRPLDWAGACRAEADLTRLLRWQ